MEDKDLGWILGLLALTLVMLQAKRIERLEKDIRALADGDPEIVKLRRKLEGDDGG